MLGLRSCGSNINTLGFINALSSRTCRFNDMPDPNIFKFDYALNLSACGAENIADQTSLGSAMR